MLTDEKDKINDVTHLYGDIINNMQIGLHVYHLEDIDDDRTLRMIAANPAAAEYTGCAVENIVGKTIDENFPGLRAKEIPQKYADVVRTQKAIVLDDVYYGDDEVIGKAFSVKAFPLPDNCVGVTFENITKRKLADMLAKTKTDYLSQLIGEYDISIIGILTFDFIKEIMPADGGMFAYKNDDEKGLYEIVYKHNISINGQTKETSGNNKEFLHDSSMLARVISDKKQVTINNHVELQQSETIIPEYNGSGNEAFRSATYYPLIVFGDVIGGFCLYSYKENAYQISQERQLESIAGNLSLSLYASILSKQTERHKNELKKLADQYTALINTVPASLYIKDLDSRYLVVNEEFCKKVGLEKNRIIGKGNQDVHSEPDVEKIQESDRQVMEEEKSIINKLEKYHDVSGEQVWLSTTKVPLKNKDGSVIGLVGLTQDVTDQIRTREQLLQSDKMAAIGTLAAGVAHEINNPIGFINSNLNTMSKYIKKIEAFMEENISKSSEEFEDIKEIYEDFNCAIEESLEGANRVKNIVADLKSFSRVDKSDVEYANINDGIKATLNIVWNELKYKCEVIKDFGDIPSIPCMANQINQVFMNLLVNAGHAIDKKGTIHIKTWSDEENVHISIKDSGCGIPEENIDKIFEPFFTTKEVGKGTGLGLSLVFDIIKKHSGTIKVNSQVGVGTEFIVSLPLGEQKDA